MSETPGMDTEAIVGRMRQVVGAKNNSALATAIGLGVSAPTNWLARNAPPLLICAELAAKYCVSLDWLIFGRGAMRPADAASAAATPGAPGQRSEQAQRLTQFVEFFDATKSADDIVWLEQHLKRTVPEYAEWLAGGARSH